MLRKKTASFVVALLSTVILTATGEAAANSSATLKQQVAELQEQPNDKALREKVISLAAALKPAPAIPEEARRHFVKAVTLQKEAKGSSDFNDAAAEYRLALHAAPWWGEAYYNLSIAQENAGDFNGAIESLGFYLLTRPPQADAREAQDRTYALEAKRDMAQKRAQAVSAKSPLEGRWVREEGGVRIEADSLVIEKVAGALKVSKDNHSILDVKVDGRRIMFEQHAGGIFPPGAVDLTVSADGQVLEGRYDELPPTAANMAAMKARGLTLSGEPAHYRIIYRRAR